MRLQDLRQKLYSRQSDIESRKPQSDVYDPRSKVTEEAEKSPQNQVPAEKNVTIETGTTRKQKTLLLLIASIIGGIVVLGGGGYLLYKFLKPVFSPDRVKLTIDVASAVNLNEDVNLEIICANNNPLALKDAHLTLEAPANFLISSEGAEPPADSISRSVAEWNLGNFSPQENRILKLRGRFTGREEDSAVFKAAIRYIPSNFNSPFQNETTSGTRVIGIPASFFVEATREAATGFAISYQVKIRNNGNEPFQNLSVKLEYPMGFSFVNSSSPLEGESNNSWAIPTLLSNEEKGLTIEGKIEGRIGEQKILNARFGKNEPDGFKEYIRKEALTTVTEPPIVLSQEVLNEKKVVHKGEDLNFTIKYANKSERPISNNIVKLKVEGAIFDFKNTIVENGGAYDSNTKEIVWQGGKIPELALLNPGSSGELRFKLKVADFIPFTNEQRSNFTGRTTVSIESPEIPTPIGSNKVVTGNTLDFKLGTKAGLQSSAFYSDGTIPNSGPVPPTVGKKTTYTVHWTVSNAFNDLRNVEVKSILPYGVEWTDKVFPSKTGVEYRERTREVIWNLERIPTGAGGDRPASSLVFQIAITPTENEVGNLMELLDETTLRGTDVFTQETINEKFAKLNTALPDDKSMNESMGRVIRPGEEL